MNSEINLLNFCKEPIHISLKQPLNMDGYTYVSNGHIAIRVAANPDYKTSDPNWHRWPRQIEQWIVDRLKVDKLQPLPDYEAPEPRQCFCCGGSGKVLDDDDDGEESATSYVCTVCGGSGKTDMVPVVFGNIGVSHHYLKMLQDLPNLKIDLTGGPKDMIPFTFDGGVGLVMPMKLP